jgi:hypothetical protein
VNDPVEGESGCRPTLEMTGQVAMASGCRQSSGESPTATISTEVFVALVSPVYWTMNVGFCPVVATESEARSISRSFAVSKVRSVQPEISAPDESRIVRAAPV